MMDDIVREGARRMLAAVLQAEVNQYIAVRSSQNLSTAGTGPSACFNSPAHHLSETTPNLILKRSVGLPAPLHNGAGPARVMCRAAGDCKTFGVTPDHGRCIDDQRQRDRGRTRRAV